MQQLGAPPSALVLVYQSTGSARAGDPAFEAAVRAETAGVASAPYVRQVESHLLAPSQVSADRRVAYDVVLLDIAPDDSPAALPGIQAALRTAPGRQRVAGRRAGRSTATSRPSPSRTCAGPSSSACRWRRIALAARLRLADRGRRPPRHRRRGRRDVARR